MQAIPDFNGGVFNFYSGFRDRHSGIIDCDIESTIAFDRCIHGMDPLGLHADIQMDKNSLSTCLNNIVCDRSASLFVNVSHHDPGSTLLSVESTGRCTDAGSAARHYGNLVF